MTAPQPAIVAGGPAPTPDGDSTGPGTDRPGRGSYADAARLVPCPDCAAPAFARCRIRRGGSHAARIRAGIAAVTALAMQLRPRDEDAFVLVCQRCCEVITADRPGHARVDRRAAQRQAAAQRFQRGGQAAPRPPRIPWVLLHRDCDPDADAQGHHHLRGADICSARRLLRASSALVELNWATLTAWQDLVGYIVRGSAIVRDFHALQAVRHADAVQRAGLADSPDSTPP